MHTCKHAGACTHTLLMSAQINNPAEFLLFPSGWMHWCTSAQHEALSGNIIRAMIMKSKIFMLCGQCTHAHTVMDTQYIIKYRKVLVGRGHKGSDALSLTQ